MSILAGDFNQLRPHFPNTLKGQPQSDVGFIYHHRLVKYIESQNYFEFADRYGMGWTDITVVTTTVTIGNKRKTIKTGHEGEVPLELWGIHRAIDGVLSHITWDPSRIQGAKSTTR